VDADRDRAMGVEEEGFYTARSIYTSASSLLNSPSAVTALTHRTSTATTPLATAFWTPCGSIYTRYIYIYIYIHIYIYIYILDIYIYMYIYIFDPARFSRYRHPRTHPRTRRLPNTTHPPNHRKHIT
jgi:hypothetical protein